MEESDQSKGDMTPQKSQLKLYSLGTVAANKKLDSDIVEVVPLEQMPMLDGDVNSLEQKDKAKGKNASGEAFNKEVTGTNSIQAKWLPLGDTNRKSAPDVRRGEWVRIYQFADSDEYYWATLNHNKKLRKLETVNWSFSNTKKEEEEENANNTYWMEISTHKKLIHLHTSKNDEEPFAYDIQLNTKDGNLTIYDNDENYIFLDSKNRRIKLHNKDDSFIDLNKKKIWINAVDEIKMTTKHLIINASNKIDQTTTTWNMTDQTATHKTGTYKQTSGSYTNQTGSYKLTAGSFNTTTPTANFNGSMKISASAMINGGLVVNGGSVLNGGLSHPGHTH